MPTIDEIIGQRLRARRELMGRSSDEFAEYLGIAAHELELIESGARRLGADLMRKACDILDVQPVYFFADTALESENGDNEGNRDDDDDAGVRH